ncbi:MAG: bifunctional demethylmenaquinone methyltransferase/2-methoxy-6-polyprenyl-1,4-benzoquinol methylase UbiE [Bryobacteraceae bacterium]|nr:bifunctional demethylmenaquinone methyltransferase/2-methoxy-6-polyprenyl-1,4-benzoquinol methylase UbiE [Bryobacteraceae bacterium]
MTPKARPNKPGASFHKGEGATPRGAATPEQAAAYVRTMFGRVAGRYDFLNHLLSFQLDRSWRRRTIRTLSRILAREGTLIMDVCCGTGDLLLAMESKAKGSVIGCDFCHPMLLEAQRKSARKRAYAPLFEADALRLPLPDNSLDLLTVAFGFRNLTDYRAGLVEFQRVLKPAGTLAILEFSNPPNFLFRALYKLYSRFILPAVGGAISGAPDAYSYLPESVEKFPEAEKLAATMESVGFTRVRFQRMTFGVVALHLGLAG